MDDKVFEEDEVVEIGLLSEENVMIGLSTASILIHDNECMHII